MSAAERRAIHVALTDHPRVVTQSVGEGEDRKVTIMPRTGEPLPRVRPNRGRRRPHGNVQPGM